MKKPKLKNLSVDSAETANIRDTMSRQKSVKITININADVLAKLRHIADKSGVPYQRLINRTLVDSLHSQKSNESRIDRIEKELRVIKRKLAA